MRRGTAVLVVLLCFGILTIWVDGLWAWSLFQAGIFGLASWRIIVGQSSACAGLQSRLSGALAVLASAAAWPFVQIVAGTSSSHSETLLQALNWCTFVVVFAVAAELLASERDRRIFLGILTGFGAVLAFVSTLQSYTSQGRIFWLIPSAYAADVLGPFVNRNQFAAWVELLLPLALYQTLTNGRFRVPFGCAAAVLFSSVIASASRAGSALVCGEALVVVAAVAARRATPRKVFALAAVQFLALAVVAAAILGWQNLGVRLASAQPDVVRLDAFRASVDMVREHPWAGSGLGTWAITYPRYAGFDSGLYVNQAHNDWIQWAAEGGIPFVFLLVVFALLLCKPALRSIYGVGIVAFLLHAFIDYPMQQRPALAAWFFALAGTVMSRDSTRAHDV